MGTNSYCNRGRNRNRSRTQDINICSSSTSVLNQQQTTQPVNPNNSQSTEMQVQANHQNSSNQSQDMSVLPPNSSSTAPATSNNNINQIISNHISSYNLYPYYVPPATGKNKRLKKDFYKYFKFDKKITEKQLQAKRDEFWDTAPAFDGKTEIWAALKAAVEACENKNYQLAQAIIDSANIILPNGLLNDCYDELGNRYEIPIYVLAKPSNLIKSSSMNINNNSSNKNEISIDDESSSSNNNSNKKNKENEKNNINSDDNDEDEDNSDDNNSLGGFDEDEISNLEDENNNNITNDSDAMNNNNNINNNCVNNSKKNGGKKLFQSSKSKLNNIKLKLANGDNNVNTSSSNKKSKLKKNLDNNVNNSNNNSSTKTKASTSKNKTITVKLRVSALHNEQDDIKLNVNLSQTVLSVKQMLKEYINVEPLNQRMFFGGKLLKDKDRLKGHRLRKNVVIQVIIKDSDDDLIKAYLANYLKQKELLNDNIENFQKLEKNDLTNSENIIYEKSINIDQNKENNSMNEIIVNNDDNNNNSKNES